MASDTDTKPTSPGAPNGGGGDEQIDDVPIYRKKRLVIPLFLMLLAAVGGGWYWYMSTKNYVSTDDAYVDANRVSVSAKILGRITTLAVDEGDTVHAGDILVRLDDSDIRSQRNQAAAALSLAEESISLSKVNEEKSGDDFHRAALQYKQAVITKEQYDHAQKAAEAARSEYAIALSRVKAAESQVAVFDTQLKNTIITAPSDGVVARRWLLPGDVVQPGQAIFSLFDLHDLWVTANLEETNLQYIRLGDPVEISVDAYPGRSFTGKVIQIGTYTASQFSLIPPNNASGNFTKVTQRIPVKISIVDAASPVDAPLFPGMSVEVSIRLR